MSFRLSILLAFFVLILCILCPVCAIYYKLYYFIGIVIPYIALFIFICGFILKVINWGKSSVPFCIPTTCGQQKSLDWIKQHRLENPFTKMDVFLRMFLEVIFFRSLFRNNRVYFYKDKLKVAYFSSKWLWLFAMLFHYSFLIVLLRHLRFFTEKVPSFIHFIEKIDGFLKVGIPIMYVSGIILLISTLLLFLRRVIIGKLRYISLTGDYFPLLLIMAIATTGIMMRYFYRIDVVAVKELAMGLVTFNPVIPENHINMFFYIHLFLVCTLFTYLPFSKIMHASGVLFSPTRNLANNSRVIRHINPWNPVVEVHTYEDYENEFRAKMKKVGLPVEKE